MAIPLLNCGTDSNDGSGDDPDAGAEAAPPKRRDASTDQSAPDGGFVTEKSGTRFRTVYLERVYDDDTSLREHLTYFWDKQLGGMCSIQEVGQDTWACLPVVPEPRAGSLGFSDPNCTNPAIGTTIYSTDNRFVRFGDSCASRFATVEGASNGELYEKNASGECVMTSIGVDLVPLSSEIPASTFGTFTRTKETTLLPTEKGGTRLVLESERFSGEDGSFEVHAPRIVDTTLNSTGAVVTTTDGKTRFVPAQNSISSISSTYFANDTCTDSLVSFGTPSVCHDDPFAAKLVLSSDPSADTCPVRAYRKSGESVTSLFEKTDDACTALPGATVGSEVRAWSGLTEAAPDGFLEVTRSLSPAGGDAYSGSLLELRTVTYTSADGLELRERTTTPYLRKYDLPCVPDYLAGDVQPRCVPAMPFDDGDSEFADAACTRELIELYGTTCDGLNVPFYHRSTGNGYRVFAMPTAAPLALTTKYLKETNGVCRPMEASPGATYFDRGTPQEIPLTEFPQATVNEIVFGD